MIKSLIQSIFARAEEIYNQNIKSLQSIPKFVFNWILFIICSQKLISSIDQIQVV